MTYNTPSTDEMSPRPMPKRESFMAIALRPWQMIASVITRHKAYAALSAMDDRLLKDIGISRGEIERVTFDTAVLHHQSHKQPTPGQLRAAAGSRLLLPPTRR